MRSFTKRSTRAARAARAALGAALLLTACTDSTAPATRGFALTAIGDAALPASVFEGDVPVSSSATGHLIILATSGTFSLSPAGHYEQRVSHDAYIDGVLVSKVLRTDRGQCTVAGTALSCESEYIQGVTFSGTITDADVTIAQDIAGEGVVASYRYSGAR